MAYNQFGDRISLGAGNQHLLKTTSYFKAYEKDVVISILQI